MRPATRILVAALLAAIAALAPAGVANAGPAAPDVPTGLQAPAGNKVFLVAHATGVQIYSCTAGANGYSWTLVAPRANLYNDHGKLIGTHFAGPTWQAKDGSSVRAARFADPVTVDPTAVPWLLLKKTSTTSGVDGDRLTGTTFIQRIRTVGGLAPAAGQCNATTVGDRAESDYTADYYFWKATGPTGA
jgi:Protein of unknown function (DUF3455)